jgi:hypothetical protein
MPYHAGMVKPEKISQLNVNIPETLKTTLASIAEGSGTDLTGLITRALHEWLAEGGIASATQAAVLGQFVQGATCARCDARTDQWEVIGDDPLITVCAPYCSDGPTDANGNQLEVGDRVILYYGARGRIVTGAILSFTVDGSWTSLAQVQVPGARRPYVQATRKLRKYEQ